MVASYKKIDYRLRPAKHAERLMLCDAIRRLRFATIESYQYVGLGSVYFQDFSLVHKALGISDLCSIESQIEDTARFTDNLPFSSIKMMWGETNTELPKVDLLKRTIAWLDYDDRLKSPILDDIQSFVSRVVSGSMLIISVQCSPAIAEVSKPRKLVEKLEHELGKHRIDPVLMDDDLVGWGTAKCFRKILNDEIQAVLKSVNGVKAPNQRLEYQQILNFEYADGARMLTIGGVFFDHGQRPIFEHCGFDELEFVRKDDEAFRIEMPKLTPREISQIERQLPLSDGKVPDYGSVPVEEANKFIRFYRYFPNFGTIQL